MFQVFHVPRISVRTFKHCPVLHIDHGRGNRTATALSMSPGYPLMFFPGEQPVVYPVTAVIDRPEVLP